MQVRRHLEPKIFAGAESYGGGGVRNPKGFPSCEPHALLRWKLNQFVYGGGLYLFLSIRLFVFQVVSFPLSVSLAGKMGVGGDSL